MRIRRIIISAVVIAGCILLPLSIFVYLQAADERRAANKTVTATLCSDNQDDWDTLHAVIGNIGEPSPTGNAITRLFIPPETPDYIKIILAQLATPLTEKQKAEIRAPFYFEQGPRPICPTPVS